MENIRRDTIVLATMGERSLNRFHWDINKENHFYRHIQGHIY